MAPDSLTPLTNVPISVFVDGEEITGTILSLYPNDIEIEWNGRRTGLHVPYFMMVERFRLATTGGDGHVTGLTARGREQAVRLLAELAGYPEPSPKRGSDRS